MTSKMRRDVLEHIFKMVVIESGDNEFYKFVSDNFLSTCINAMKTLFDAKKANLILKLCKYFESRNPHMPLDRMPFGLLDYNIKFFSSTSSVNLQMESHYASWLETVFAQFGHKWLCLQRGPTITWCYEQECKKEDSVDSGSKPDNINQEALQCSLIDLEGCCKEHVCDEVLEDVNNSILNLSLDGNEVPIISTPIQKTETQKPTSTVASLVEYDDHHENCVGISHLWSSFSPKDKQEIELGLVSPDQMDNFHNVVPKPNSTSNRNPDTFNPLKVQYGNMSYIILPNLIPDNFTSQ